jgi:[ribosomal protein S5]-alanine N-acetyltransferase
MTELHIQTDRFLLRKPRLSDASAIFDAYAQDDLVVQYLVWRKHTDIEATKQFVTYCIDQWASGQSQPLVIQEHDTERVVGMIDLRRTGHRVNLGYVLARSHWGKGCMTEVCAAIIGYLFSSNPPTFRIEAVCDLENVASARVMEKLGMKREGVLRAYMTHPNVSTMPRDVYMYSLVQDDQRINDSVQTAAPCR